MISLDPKNNSAKITLNREFYNPDIVKSCASDFKHLANFSIETSEDIAITITPKNREYLEKICYEFCNYVLGTMKNNF